MLVLSRKPEESILIGDHVYVKILSIRGNRVRLGITAPRSVEVDRIEVRKLKEEDKKKKQTEEVAALQSKT